MAMDKHSFILLIIAFSFFLRLWLSIHEFINVVHSSAKLSDRQTQLQPVLIF